MVFSNGSYVIRCLLCLLCYDVNFFFTTFWLQYTSYFTVVWVFYSSSSAFIKKLFCFFVADCRLCWELRLIWISYYMHARVWRILIIDRLKWRKLWNFTQSTNSVVRCMAIDFVHGKCWSRVKTYQCHQNVVLSLGTVSHDCLLSWQSLSLDKIVCGGFSWWCNFVYGLNYVVWTGPYNSVL